MARLTFKIKQHSPIIHSYYGHPNEILRATELKSKMKFYLKKHGIEGVRIMMRTSCPGRVISDIPNRKLFLGNMGRDRSNLIKSHFSTDTLTLKINTPISDIEDKVKQSVTEALCLENFGSCGSKGFGCFVPEDIGKSEFEGILKDNVKVKPILRYYVDQTERIYPKIADIYTKIKRGNHSANPPFTSIVRDYFLAKDITWEKRMIKETFFRGSRSLDNIKGKQRYCRGILGTSTEQEWRNQGKIIEVHGGEFERVPSSLIFKVFYDKTDGKHYIYFWFNNYHGKFDNLYGAQFNFNIKNDTSAGSLSLRIPSKTEFNPSEFMKYIKKRLPYLESDDVW